MPRLTYQPSGISRARRAAISARVIGRHFATTLAAVSFTGFFSSSDNRFAIGHVQHAIDVDAGGRDLFRIQRAEIDNVLRLHDRQRRRHRHDRIEITRRRSIGQVTPAVRLPRLDQRDIPGERLFKQVAASAYFALLLAGGELGADGGGGEEGGNASAGGAQALRQRTLRHDFQFDFAGPIKLLEYDRIDGTRIRANDLAHAPEFEEPRQTDAADAGIVGDNGEIFGAMFDQSIDQRVRLTDAPEAAEQHRRAIANAGHGFGHGLHDLVDHWKASRAARPCESGDPEHLYLS